MNSPFAFVIFGATGDLAHHKLIPGLFSLYKQKQLPGKFFIIGFARRDLDNTSFANLFTECNSDPQWNDFSSHLIYHQGEFQEESGYLSLSKKLDAIAQSLELPLIHVFYLATPPQNYETILKYLDTYEKALAQDEVHHGRWAKLAIEKPF